MSKLNPPVVTLAVDAKVFDLVERDGLVLAGPLVGRLVPLGVGAERPQVHLARRDGPHRVDDDGHEGVLEVSLSLGHGFDRSDPWTHMD